MVVRRVGRRRAWRRFAGYKRRKEEARGGSTNSAATAAAPVVVRVPGLTDGGESSRRGSSVLEGWASGEIADLLDMASRPETTPDFR
jgi:hypothetical protein